MLMTVLKFNISVTGIRTNSQFRCAGTLSRLMFTCKEDGDFEICYINLVNLNVNEDIN